MSINYDSLLASNWHDWAPKQVEDGIIDIFVEDSLNDQARQFALETVQQIDEIIGTPVRINTADRPDLDIRIGSVPSFDNFDVSGSPGGLATVDDDGVSNALIREDLVRLVPIQITERRAARRARRAAKGKELRPLPEQLAASTKRIINHEILHAFGLSHPDDDGHAPAWDTDDSIMSYRLVGDLDYGLNSSIGHHDVQALQEIWGCADSCHLL